MAKNCYFRQSYAKIMGHFRILAEYENHKQKLSVKRVLEKDTILTNHI